MLSTYIGNFAGATFRENEQNIAGIDRTIAIFVIGKN